MSHLARADGLTHVTGLIKQFTPKFDPDGVIKRTKAEEMGITEEELARKWEEKSLRGRVRGQAIGYYLERTARGEKYIGGHLPEFPQIDAFLTVYEVLETEREYKNDVVFGRPDIIAKHRETGEKVLFDLKTGELGSISFGNFLPPFESCPQSPMHTAKIQTAMYVRLVGGDVKKGMILHVGPDNWEAFEVMDSDYEIADCMFEWQRGKKDEATKVGA